MKYRKLGIIASTGRLSDHSRERYPHDETGVAMKISCTRACPGDEDMGEELGKL